STDAASIEEVSLVVRSYVDALLDAPEALSTPLPNEPELPPEAPTDTPPPRTKRERPKASPYLRLELAYAPSAIDLSATWQQGAAISLVVRHLAPVTFGASYTFLTHLSVENDVSFTLQRHPVSLFAGIPIDITNRVTLEPRLALEADVTLRRSTSTNE